MSTIEREAARQQALLAALWSREAPAADARLVQRGERLRRGLVAYRANAETIAERALAAAYPTVQALVGDADFAALARALWRASPPRRGDLAHWGSDLPEFIEGQRDLDPWPYLGDGARLDAALRRCEAAADAELSRDSLTLLAAHDPAVLRLRLQPNVQLLASRWPIASLHAAHQTAPDVDLDAAFAPVREALAAGRGEAVVVARQGWRAVPERVESGVYAWMQALRQGVALTAALSAAGDGFDFNAWLVQALQQGWLWRAETMADLLEERSDDHPDLA